jgi:hypothetical protein
LTKIQKWKQVLIILLATINETFVLSEKS